ncbi:MAG TPA: hypothetical protein H9758_12440 [Candidatus Mediterraneibacter faecipullorum]|uniref:Gram-positive cocci surface proteins LPxTG domain-containing protein n=1 Tax=Candidatus Mediterraneibacter faecipullorum TaxID=2838670 RepID=A0A9D2NQC7_9FIRM|nr:hypothetical protein [Candidatus Mediterraneibacter faecipullorum]
MRKWSMIMKKMTVLLLSAMLISAMMPGQARAQEQSEQDDTKISVQSGDTDSGSEFETEEDTDSPQADDAAGSDNAIQTTDVQDTGAEKETSGTDDKSDPSDDDQNDGQQSEDAKENGQQNEDAKEDGQQTGSGQEGTWPGGIPEITRDPMAFPILMDSSNELYSSLSQFLSLSSDQFQIYTVAVIDPVTQQPVQPDSPVEVSLDMPSGYDTDRVVVSEISMDGETPVRTELSFTYNNGKAVFETDHSGIYVVMEKKVQPQLPASLEMTSKVEKLELTKKYPDSVSLTSSSGTRTLNPQTGDDNSVLIWGVVTAIAAAAVIALVVIIIKRRK